MLRKPLDPVASHIILGGWKRPRSFSPSLTSHPDDFCRAVQEWSDLTYRLFDGVLIGVPYSAIERLVPEDRDV